MKPLTLSHAAAVVGLTLALGAPAHASAAAWTVDTDHSVVGFEVRHLLGNVRGKFDHYQGAVTMDAQHPELGSVQFSIDTKSIDTGVDKRDEHLRSAGFFDVANHPQITFTSSKIVPLADHKYAVAGTLSMRGVSRQVTLPVALLGTVKDPWGNTRAGFTTTLTLNRKDYGINWNKQLDEGGYLLGDEVTVEIQLEAVQQKDQAGK